MKLTRHNGRAGKNGAYNPKHNDRRFDVENSEHIDPVRARKNIYWDCYQGFSSELLGEGKGKDSLKYFFEDAERIYYLNTMLTMCRHRTNGMRNQGIWNATERWMIC